MNAQQWSASDILTGIERYTGIRITGTIYLTRAPAARVPNKVLVHHNVTPAGEPGSRGFRAWLADPSTRYVECQCEWAPHVGRHFCVRRLAR